MVKGGIARIPRYGSLIIHHADRDAPAAETANDPQSLVITAKYDGADFMLP
jgi:hypothetical protein